MQQLADALVGRGGFSDHPVEHRRELDQRELVGEGESAVFGPQLRRHAESPPVRIVNLADVPELRLWNDRRADPPGFLEPPPHRLGHGQRIAERAAQRLGRLLQLGVMVAVLLDIVAHPVLGRDERASIAPFHVWMPLGFLHRRVEPGDRVGDGGRVVGEFNQLVARHAEVAEKGVGENLTEGVGARASAAAGRESPHVDVVKLGQLQQQRCGHRPLVALQMIEIAGADPEALRHVCLGRLMVAAQAAQAVTQEEFGRHGSHVVNLRPKRQVNF